MNDEARSPTVDGDSVWSFDCSELFWHSTFGFRHCARLRSGRDHMCSITLSPNCEHPPSLEATADAMSGLSMLHVINHVLSKFAALDLRRAVHQTREIIRNAFAFYRTTQAFENQIGSFRPAHVTEHHFTGKNYRAGIHFVPICVFRRCAMCSFDICVTCYVLDGSSRRDADCAHLRGQRVTQIIAIQI